MCLNVLVGARCCEPSWVSLSAFPPPLPVCMLGRCLGWWTISSKYLKYYTKRSLATRPLPTHAHTHTVANVEHGREIAQRPKTYDSSPNSRFSLYIFNFATDKNELEGAQHFLEQAATNNQPDFLKALSDVLSHPGNSAVARMAAGLQLKNQLTSKDEAVKLKFQTNWLQLPEDIRNYIKKNVGRILILIMTQFIYFNSF